ncbi:Uncharacterized protein dnm_011510 [Desulfonema magnum]|uniref:Uncharacterized protein n=1 Tax=Desulfonema magnum TaxID=45655 RepID=A0A975BGV6_9BACT|nr:Uncharacterized protein dnm_011510 [Desulfonema magnum]
MTDRPAFNRETHEKKYETIRKQTENFPGSGIFPCVPCVSRLKKIARPVFGDICHFSNTL